MKKVLFFLMAIIFAIQGYGQSTLVVANGTATNSFLPAYGLYMDENQHNQFIYPMTEVGALSGATISKITFHASSTTANSAWGTATCVISLGVTTQTNYASASYDLSTLTQVYSGPISIVNGIMEFTLTTPYLFSGGNLLVDIQTSTGNVYDFGISYYGITSTNGGLYKYVSSLLTLQSFLPKMTALYTGGTPTVVTASATPVYATSATLNGAFFNLTAVTNGFQYMPATSTDWTSATTITASTTTSPMTETVSSLVPNTQYKFRAFGNDGTTFYYGNELTFTTLALPAYLPYACDFENPTENAEWTFINGTQTNKFYIGDATQNPAINNTVGGSNALYISPDTGATWAYSAGSSNNSWVYAYRDFEVPAGVNELKLDFDWIANGGVATSEFLRVYWMPVNIPVTAGNLPPTVNSINYDLAAMIGNYTGGYGSHWLSRQTTWQHATFTINTTQYPTLAGNTWRMYVHWRNNQTAAVQPPATFDNMTLVVSNCPTPRIDSINNITTSTADLYFSEFGTTNTWNFQYRILGTTTWTDAQGNLNPYTLSGLQPSTSYEVRMQSDCSSEQSAWSPIKKFNTACGTITQIPWADYFDNYGTGETIFPACWTRKTNVTNRPYISSTNFTSPGSMYFYCGSAGNYNIASTPMIDVTYPINTLMLNFRTYFDGIDDTLYVGTMTDPNFDTTFTEIAKFYSTTTYSFINQVLYLNNYQGTDQYISFKTKYGASPSYIYIDNLQVLPLPTCMMPHSYFVNNINPYDVTVNWTASDPTNSEWYLYFKPSSSPIWDSVQVFGTTHTLTTLTSNTLYQYYIRTVCGADFSDATNISSFRTSCTAIDLLPYSENFDSYGTGSYINYPSCWTRLSNYSGGSTYPSISSTNFSTPGSLYMYCYNNTYSLAALHSVDPTLNMNQLKLNFKMFSYSTSYNLKVGVMTNPLDKNTFVQIGPNITVNSTSVWEDKEVVFSSYPGLGRNIAFLVEDVLGSYNYCYIDNVVIDLLPPCPNVYSFNTEVVSTTSFSVNWDNSTDDGSGYILSYAVNPTTLPFDPTTGTQVPIPTGTAMPYVVSSLNPGDIIYTAVQAGCGGNWTTPQSVILPTVVATIPYTCNFEDTTQNATWTLQNGTQPNKWYIGAPGANGGTGNGLYISSDNGVTATYTLGVSATVMASTVIQFNNAPEFALSFDWANYGENNYDYVIAFLVPLSYNITPGTVIPETYRITPNLNSSAVWQTRNVVLGSQYSNTVKRLVFQWKNDTSGGSNPPGLVDNVIINPLTCTSPSNLVYSNVGTTTADLTWNNFPVGAEFLVEYKLASATTWDQATTIDSTYQLTLLPSFIYNARIRAVCTPGDTSFASNMVTFQTLCVALTPPTATEPFLTMLPNTCWSMKQGVLPATGNATLNTVTSGWYIRTNLTPNTAAVNMYGTPQYWLITPSIDLGDGSTQYQMDFDLARTAGYSTSLGNMDLSPNARFVVLISTDNGTTWNSTGILKEWNNSTGTPFSTLTNSLQSQTIGLFDPVSLSPYTGIVKFAFFAYENDASYIYYNDIHVDNFQINPYNACVTPMDIVFSAITTTTATASWDSNPTAVSYEVVYGLPGVDPATATPIPVTDTFYVMTPLTATTLYHFYVRSVCAGGEFSEWTSLRTFSTVALAPVPYTEPFATATVPVGYTLTEFSVGSQTYVPGNPASNIYYNVDSYPGSGKFSTINIGPLLPNYELAFEYKLALYSGGGVVPTGTGHFIVAISTDWGNTYTNVDTVDNNGLAGYQPYSLDLSAYDTEIIKIKITANWISNDYWIGIDNIYVGPAITCPYPTAVISSNATQTSVDMSWTENGTATAWQIEYGAPGFTQGTGTFVTAPTNTLFTVTGLTATTCYDAYVRTICGVGDSSIWSNKITFCTAQIPATLPFIVDFETPSGFQIANNATGNNWYIGSAVNNTIGGQNALYVSNDNGVTNIYDTNTAAVVWAYRDVQFPTSAADFTLSFDWRSVGEANAWDYINVYIGSVTNPIPSTTATITQPTGSDTIVTKLRFQTTWQTATFSLPVANYSGQTKRIYFMWRNDTSLGTQPPAAIDNISITTLTPACAVPTNLAVSPNNTDATATWTAGGTETQWEIAYKANTDLTWLTALVSTTPTYVIPALTPNTQYNVKVRAICTPGDTSAYTAIVDFTTTTVSCNAPTNLAAGTITNTGATITWTAGGTETSWEVDYKLATASTWTTVTTTAASKVLTDLATCSNYNVRVRAECGVGIFSSYTTVVNFNTLSPVPSNLQVTNITDQAALATWTAGGTETSWQVEYKLVSSANWTTATVNGTPSHPLTGLQSNSLYEVRVKSLCSPNESAFTTPVQFTTLGMTFTINATAGLNGTITPSGTVTVNAGANQTFTFGPNTGYVVDVVTVNGTPIVGTPISYTFTNIMANHTINVEFTVGIEENELAQLVELFPNPTTSIIELRLKSDELHVTECKVFDMYGKLMRVIPINAETTSIDVTDFASGVYFVRMDSERGTISKKFVKK